MADIVERLKIGHAYHEINDEVLGATIWPTLRPHEIDVVMQMGADEITSLREACNIALGSLKALGAEKGYAAEMLRKALGTAHDGEKR